MKKYSFSLIIITLITGVTALGQTSLSNRLSNLEYQGKYKEAIPLMDKYIDSLRQAAKKDPSTENSFEVFFRMEAGLYMITGEYEKAEKRLTQVLSQMPADKNHDEERRQALSQMALLYETMGNASAEQMILEKLVVSEYTGYDAKQDKKALFFQYYNHIIKTSGMKIDSVELDKDREEQWNNYLAMLKLPDTGENAYALRMLEFQMEMQHGTDRRFASASPAQLSLLRSGKLVLGGKRNGAIDSKPWDEVERLFVIYKKTGNLVAAEALIRQAISIDDANAGERGNATNALLETLFQPGVNPLEKSGISKVSMSNMRQAISSGHKYGGVDIFYIQNKVLLAQLYNESGRDGAYRLLKDTLYNLCKKLDTVSNTFIIGYLARAYIDMNEVPEAIKAYKRIIDYEKDKSGKLSVSSFLYLEALQQLSALYALRDDYGAAKNSLKEALDYDRKARAESYPDHRKRLIAMAKLIESTGDLTGAEQFCNAALTPVMGTLQRDLAFLSEREKISLINSENDEFDFSASLLYSNPNPSAAIVLNTYAHQLQLKGLVLNDEEKLLNSIRRNPDPALKQLFDQWQSNRSAIAWQYSQPASASAINLIDSLSAIANQQEKKINELSQVYNSYQQNQQVDFKQIQNRLKAGEAAIEYIRFSYFHKRQTDSVFYAAFVIRPGDVAPQFIKLCEERTLAALLLNNKSSSAAFIQGLYGNGVNPGVNSDNRKSDSLYRLVWEPLSGLLKGTNKIDIAPAGLLCRVSFNALPFDKENYLIDKYELRQYNSIKQIAEQHIPLKGTSQKDAVLYGDINYGEKAEVMAGGSLKSSGRIWGPLPTLEQINDIGILLRANNKNIDILTGWDASEESLKALSGRSPGILHIATHGFAKPDLNSVDADKITPQKYPQIADDAMFRSGIIMAGANKVWSGGEPEAGKDDGIVSAYEIANLDFSGTELVVLSSCETALGDIRGTEGVFGLQRAFKLAGVRDMLLGMWDLPVEETGRMMKIFYTYKINGADDYQAFKMAQAELRKNNPPYKWAGMVLIE